MFSIKWKLFLLLRLEQNIEDRVSHQSAKAPLAHCAEQVGGLPFLYHLVTLYLAHEDAADVQVVIRGRRAHEISRVFAGRNKADADQITFAQNMRKFHIHIAKCALHAFHEIDVFLFIEIHPIACVGEVIRQYP